MATPLDLVGELQRREIPCLVVGGLAVVLYGIPRATFDLDLLIPPDVQVIGQILRLLRQRRYTSAFSISGQFPSHRLRRIAPLSRLTPEHVLRRRTVRFKNGQDLDLLMAPSKAYFEFLWKYRRQVTFHRMKIPVPNPLDLIRLKEWSGRPRDREDVQALRQILLKRRR